MMFQLSRKLVAALPNRDTERSKIKVKYIIYSFFAISFGLYQETHRFPFKPFA